MKMMNVFAALLAVSTILIANPVQAEYLPAEENASARIDSYELVLEFLNSERFSPNRVDLRGLSDDPVADLMNVVGSRQDATVKARAIQSLALFTGDERAMDTLSTLKAHTKLTDRLMPTIIIAWAQVHGEDVATELVELAQNERVEIRVAAVVALGRFGGQTGYDSLAKLAAQERDARVRNRIESYIR